MPGRRDRRRDGVGSAYARTDAVMLLIGILRSN